MKLQSTPSRGLSGTLQVQITSERFPAVTEACLADANFQKLIANNLERVVEEYLAAAEVQLMAAKNESETE